MKRKTDYTTGEDKSMFGRIYKVSGPCNLFSLSILIFKVVVAENMSGAKMYELVGPILMTINF